jgi:hypothetical protein
LLRGSTSQSRRARARARPAAGRPRGLSGTAAPLGPRMGAHGCYWMLAALPRSATRGFGGRARGAGPGRGRPADAPTRFLSKLRLRSPARLSVLDQTNPRIRRAGPNLPPRLGMACRIAGHPPGPFGRWRRGSCAPSTQHRSAAPASRQRAEAVRQRASRGWAAPLKSRETVAGAPQVGRGSQPPRTAPGLLCSCLSPAAFTAATSPPACVPRGGGSVGRRWLGSGDVAHASLRLWTWVERGGRGALLLRCNVWAQSLVFKAGLQPRGPRRTRERSSV